MMAMLPGCCTRRSPVWYALATLDEPLLDDRTAGYIREGRLFKNNAAGMAGL
jgi:hypothetical protein